MTRRPPLPVLLLTPLVLLLVVALLATPALLPRADAVTAPGATDPVGVWPLVPQPAVVHDFDPPSDPYGAGHRGVDLAGSPGQVVRAALAGRVSFAAVLAGRGVVVVDHGGTRTTYEPVTASVAAGDQVTAGAPLGRLALPGSHCLPTACLHWGWLRGEVYLDPLDLVGAGPVRLLPLWRDVPVGGPALPLVGAPFDPPLQARGWAWR
ncbi:MAG: peptidase M23 [Nocardioides sp.]|nr:peptidase M23 [Nocardioides sp.]